MTLRNSVPLKVIALSLCCSFALLAGCASTPVATDLQLDTPSVPTSEPPARIPAADFLVSGGFHMVSDDAEFEGQELIVRNGQFLEMRNFTMSTGEYTFTAERGTLDRSTGRITMEGKVQFSPTPSSGWIAPDSNSRTRITMEAGAQVSPTPSSE